jgi:hypothetical protein
LEKEFSERTLTFKTPDLAAIDSQNFYSFLTKNLQDALSEYDVINALKSVSDSTLNNFMETLNVNIANGLSISYLDLPLKVALELNQALKCDPWIGLHSDL